MGVLFTSISSSFSNALPEGSPSSGQCLRNVSNLYFPLDYIFKELQLTNKLAVAHFTCAPLEQCTNAHFVRPLICH